MNLPFRFRARLAQCSQKTFPILFVLVDGFPTVPTVHDVVERTGVLDARLSGHDQSQTALPTVFDIKILGTAPFAFMAHPFLFLLQLGLQLLAFVDFVD